MPRGAGSSGVNRAARCKVLRCEPCRAVQGHEFSVRLAKIKRGRAKFLYADHARQVHPARLAWLQRKRKDSAHSQRLPER